MLLLFSLLACESQRLILDPELAVANILALLQEGKIDDAGAAVAQARLDHPESGAIAICAAEVADLLWHDDVAISELRALAATADRGGWSMSDARGRLGDQLFVAGRYGEAIVPLLAGAVDEATLRRRALIAAARELPYRRSQVGPLVTEQALTEGRLPELVCSIGSVQRVFTIDSGSSFTTMRRSLAQELRVRAIAQAGHMPDGTGQPIAVAVAVVDEFSVGEIWLGTVPVLVVDDERLAMRDLFGGPDRAPEGVIGLDFLNLFRLTLDPGRRAIVLERPRGLSPSDSVRCVRAEGRCLLPVTVGGYHLWFVLDTGASHSSITEQGLALLPGAAERATPSFRRVRTAGGGSVSVRELKNLVLRASLVRFDGVDLPVVPRRAGVLFPVHGVLGADLLQQCRVTLDQGRVRLEPAT
ncbi:hypothetical protein LBMAG49_15680 [Planctomycetota bacterium]|nr:hypothetical protein LBMAG49_15680 [Planctomycetota bacterium]